MITYTTGGKEFIDRIEPLWNKQRMRHSKISTNFSDYYIALTYSQRKQKFIEYGENIYISIASDNNQDIGYCVASIAKDKGEIDSLYVNENYRGYKIGTTLMNNALQWFAENQILKIELIVATGNEDVYKFYQQFGFYPRSTKLERIVTNPPKKASTVEKIIYENEIALANRSVKNAADIVAKDFMEYGSSGKIITYNQIIEHYKNAKLREYKITNFEVKLLSEKSLQATYITELDGKKALRSSLWRLEGSNWKIFFHQGTPI